MVTVRDWLLPAVPGPPAVPAVVGQHEPRDALTAAAQALKLGRTQITPTYETWQREVWGYYDELGEFRYGVDWLAEMVSRVRLRAGRIEPDQDEPVIVEEGPAAELIAELGGGTVGGRAQLMEDFATQLAVPGECWLTGEKRGDAEEWLVRSTDEIRGRRGSYEVVDLETSTNTQVEWRPLGANAMVVRVWRPHKRFHHRADAPSRSARGTMRELELVNRHIVAQYLSRLASAGLLIMPEEATFPVREEFQDADDPFVLEWIETAKEAIATPGTAAAIVPIPMRVPGDLVEKFQHVDFTLKIDEKILEKRESAIKRLATQLDLPAEVLLGLGDVNHWTAWQIEESAIKTHIAPVVERICHSLTVGYMTPRLRALEERGVDVGEVDRLVTWYDASEITMRPDRSEAAFQAYDRIELSGEALRRETGFDEADKPDGDELREQLLKRVASDPALASTVIGELTGEKLEVETPTAAPAASGDGSPGEDEDEEPTDRREPPETGDEPPPPPGATATTRLARELRELVERAETVGREQRARRPHWLEKRVDSSLRVIHPGTCGLLPVPCPYDDALERLHVLPGRTGRYECWLEANDTRLVVGRLAQQVTGPTFVDAVPELVDASGTNGSSGARSGA